MNKFYMLTVFYIFSSQCCFAEIALEGFNVEEGVKQEHKPTGELLYIEEAVAIQQVENAPVEPPPVVPEDQGTKEAPESNAQVPCTEEEPIKQVNNPPVEPPSVVPEDQGTKEAPESNTQVPCTEEEPIKQVNNPPVEPPSVVPEDQGTKEAPESNTQVPCTEEEPVKQVNNPPVEPPSVVPEDQGTKEAPEPHAQVSSAEQPVKQDENTSTEQELAALEEETVIFYLRETPIVAQREETLLQKDTVLSADEGVQESQQSAGEVFYTTEIESVHSIGEMVSVQQAESTPISIEEMTAPQVMQTAYDSNQNNKNNKIENKPQRSLFANIMISVMTAVAVGISAVCASK